MKNTLLYLLLLIVAPLILAGCDPENVIEKNTVKGKTESPADYVWDDTYVKTITFNGATITASSKDVAINGTTATITAAGYYAISGTLTDGQLIVDAPKSKVKIMLNEVTVSNSTTSPFHIKSGKKVIVFLKSGTTNTFSDAAVYTNTGEPNATICSDSYLAFTGDGKLVVKGNFNDAISSDDEIFIHNGNFALTAKDDGIRAKDFLVIHNGAINAVCTTGHALKADSTGVAGHGYIKINGGDLTLASSLGDGIHAEKRILIEDGVFNISSFDSQGLRSDSLILISGGAITIKNTKDGIKSPFITIAGGTTNVSVSKIGVEATFGNSPTTADNSLLSVTGGNLYVSALSHALFSDGNINIAGGTTLVQGPASTSKLMAKYLGAFTVSGGIFAGSGPNAGALIKGVSGTSAQNSVKLTSSSIGTNLINIQNADGSSLVTFKPTRTAYYFIFTSPELKTSAAYSVYSGGTYSNGIVTNGYYTGGIYTGGTKKTSFTVSDKITEVSY